MDIDYDFDSSDPDSTILFMQEDFDNIMAEYKEAELLTKSKEELVSDVYHLKNELKRLELKCSSTNRSGK